jgi:hypothetical protein
VSVTAIPPLTVLELPRLAIVQVNRQVELTVPLLALTSVKISFAAVVALTVTTSGEPVEIDPSVAVIEVAPERKSRRNPFLLEAAAATPLVKVRATGEPKATAVPAALTIVGAEPLGLARAPEKVSDFEPA